MCSQVSVIPSSEPEKDALSFQQLFSDFRIQKRSSTAVTLVGNTNETIVIFCKAEEIGSLSTILLVDTPISQLDGARHQAGVEVLGDDFSSREKLLLRFHGGGTLLVANKQVEPSRLAEWLVNPTSTEEEATMEDVALTPSGAIEALAFEDPAVVDKKPPAVKETATTPKGKGKQVNGKSIMEEQSAQKLPKFPTLQVSLNDTNFPLNAPAPVPVENDLFKGKVLLLLRPIDPAKDDPYWNERIWSKRKRRVRTVVGWCSYAYWWQIAFWNL